MANLSIRRLDDEVYRWLKVQARIQSTSMAEVVRRLLRDAYLGPRPMGTVIREIMGRNGVDLEIPPREVEEPIAFPSAGSDPDPQGVESR